MRAKEYLEINKSKIQYYDIVKSAIADLSLLRINKRKTSEYFNQYLFADARHLAQKEAYVPREGEIDKSYVNYVRINILNAVCHDESFIFAFNILVMQSNKYHEFVPLGIGKIKEINCRTISNIEKICSQYKEDYPKDNLIGFLHDTVNVMYYEFNQHDLNKDEEWWLYAFNQAYAIFDEMRSQRHEPFKAIELVKQYKNDDEELEFTVKNIVSRIVCEYKFDLDKKQLREMEVLTNTVNRYVRKIKKPLRIGENHEKRKEINEFGDAYIKAVEKHKNKVESQNNIIESQLNTIESLKQQVELQKLKNVSQNQLIASQKHQIESQNHQIESQNQKAAKYKKEEISKGLTISQQNIFYYYIFNELGVNFTNSKKTDWAKLISTISGKNENNIRKALSIKFDDSATKKDMRIVAKVVNDLIPKISQNILSDCE